jgi:tetratricopeptide (TPR) repeat protein
MGNGHVKPLAASPYATAGGGVVLEHRYGACLLVSLLTGSPLAELGDDVTPTEVWFQVGAYSPVDDLMIVGPTADGGQRRASIGVRRAPKLLGSEDSSVQLFASYLRVVTAHWDEVLEGRWRLALAVAASNPAVRQLAELVDIARATRNNEDFRTEVARSGRTSKTVRDRLPHIDAIVSKAIREGNIAVGPVSAGELTWRFLWSLRIRELRLQGLDQSDRTAAVTQLMPVTRGSTPGEANSLFARLEHLVDDYAPSGAKVTKLLLRNDLSGTPLADHPSGPLPPLAIAPAPAHFTGRSEVLSDVLSRLNPEEGLTAVTAIAGMGGIGKTALATYAAHEAVQRGWFPGGAVSINMHGYNQENRVTPEAAAAQFLEQLGWTGELPVSAEAIAGLWRSHLDSLARQGRAVLVLLDNVSAADQMLPLLLQGSRHRFLITSRHTLGSLPAFLVDLKELPAGESLELLQRSVQSARANDGRVDASPGDSRKLTSLCGHLPLALEIVAAFLKTDPGLRISDVVDELSELQTRLDTLEYPDVDADGRPLAVRAAFDLSYRHLDASLARAFRALGPVPGAEFTTELVGAVMNKREVTARRILASLLRAHLIERTPEHDRWNMHDLLKLYAEDCARSPAHAAEARRNKDRVLNYLMTNARDAHDQLLPPGEATGRGRFRHIKTALGWLDSEKQTLIAAVRQAGKEEDDQTLLTIGMYLIPYLQLRAAVAESIDIQNVMLECSRRMKHPGLEAEVKHNLGQALHDAHRYSEAIEKYREALAEMDGSGTPEEAQLLSSLAAALSQLGRIEEAFTCYSKSLAIYRRQKDVRGEGAVLHNLGRLYRDVGMNDQAARLLEADLLICRQTGDLKGEGVTANTLGTLYFDINDFPKAIEYFEQSLTISTGQGDTRASSSTVKNIANCHAELGEFAAALQLYEEALNVQRENGYSEEMANTLVNLAATYVDVNNLTAARMHLREALTLFSEVGDVVGVEQVRQRMDRLTESAS